MYTMNISFYNAKHREFFDCMYIYKTKGTLLEIITPTSLKLGFTLLKDALDFYMLLKVDVFLTNMLRIVTVSDIVSEE